MADPYPDIDEPEVIAWLTGQFGDDWKAFKGGPAGIDDARLFAQFRGDPDGRKVFVGMLLLADGLTSYRLRRVQIGTLEIAARAIDEQQMKADLAKLSPLVRGDLSGSEFSRLVAEHYKVWAQHTSRPAAAMVKQTGERSSTIHGWIHDARLRGFLPEAERGKRAKRQDS